MHDDRNARTRGEADTRSRWGRVRFGGRRLSALWAAVPLGLTLAAVIAAIATGGAGPRPVVGGVAVAFVCVWPFIGLTWALIVDRDTLRGATENPEQSVESAWYERAAGGAFSDTLLITGLGTAAIAFASIELSTVLALAAVILVAMGSFGVRYVAQRRRG